MSKSAYLAVFLFVSISLLCSETTKFEDVKIRRHKSGDKRELVDKYGVLTFDDDARKLTFKDEAGDSFAVPYSDVTKVVFDSDAHMNAGAATVAVSALSPLAGVLVRNIHAHDRWLYLEYTQGDHLEKVLLVLAREICDKATARVQNVFGERVTIANYPEKGKPIADEDGELDKRRIPDLKSKHSMKLDRTMHPLPEVKPDKATIVVVCPPLAATRSLPMRNFVLP